MIHETIVGLIIDLCFCVGLPTCNNVGLRLCMHISGAINCLYE